MPQQFSAIPVYFDTVDKFYDEYNVPDEVKISLLNPYLSVAGRKLFVTLPTEDVESYDKFKAAVL